MTRDWWTGTGGWLNYIQFSHLLNSSFSFLSLCQGKSPYWLSNRWCFTSVDLVLNEVSASKVMWTCRKISENSFNNLCIYFLTLCLIQCSNRTFIQFLQMRGKLHQDLSILSAPSQHSFLNVYSRSKD